MNVDTEARASGRGVPKKDLRNEKTNGRKRMTDAIYLIM